MLTRLGAIFFFIVLCLSVATPIRAQYADDYQGGLSSNINDKDDYFIQFMLWDQAWGRTIENNPGILINNHPQNTSFDIDARRLRILAMAQRLPAFRTGATRRIISPLLTPCTTTLQEHNANVSLQYIQRPNCIATYKIDGPRGEFSSQFQTFL